MTLRDPRTFRRGGTDNRYVREEGVRQTWKSLALADSKLGWVRIASLALTKTNLNTISNSVGPINRCTFTPCGFLELKQNSLR